MNEDGFVKIVGRAKDMVIRGGENIYPTEVEDFLMTHPDVLEASVSTPPPVRFRVTAVTIVLLSSAARSPYRRLFRHPRM